MKKDSQDKPSCWTNPSLADEHIKQMFVDIAQMNRIKLGSKPAERAVFRKLHGVACGSFQITSEDLPEKFFQGVFQKGKEYQTWVRFSSDTTPTSPDLNSTCGIGIKLFEVEGKKLLGEGDTQDFILQNHPVFFVNNSEEMAAFTSAGIIDKNYPAYLESHPITQNILNEMAHEVFSTLAVSYTHLTLPTILLV